MTTIEAKIKKLDESLARIRQSEVDRCLPEFSVYYNTIEWLAELVKDLNQRLTEAEARIRSHENG